jgi:nitroreductase
MSLSPEDFALLVAEANLAPSVHNTQPTRWRLTPDGEVLAFEDLSRRLAVGDPEGRDAGVSHGAAMEGFALAAASRGLEVELAPPAPEAPPGLRPVARLSLSTGATPCLLRSHVPVRRTYRGAFAKSDPSAGLEGLEASGDVRLVRDADGIAQLAQLNDQASLRTFRDKAYRAELLSWMRLSRRDPRWAQDGLNAEAMEMSPVEAAVAGRVLRPGMFEALDRFGLAAGLVAEARVVRSAKAVALFHRPEGEPPLATGRRFYRFWLQCAGAGLSAAPMAVLADDPHAREAIRQTFGLPEGRRLITAFRLGVSPRASKGRKPRLPLETLIV